MEWNVRAVEQAIKEVVIMGAHEIKYGLASKHAARLESEENYFDRELLTEATVCSE